MGNRKSEKKEEWEVRTGSGKGVVEGLRRLVC